MFYCEDLPRKEEHAEALPRNFTEKTEAETRNEEKTKEEALPRINTEFHGKDRSRDTE